MTNRDKIEEFLQNNPDFNEWYFISQVEDNLFIYYIGFVDDGNNLDGVYNCSVNLDDTIYYIRHIHNPIEEQVIIEQLIDTTTTGSYTGSNDTFI